MTAGAPARRWIGVLLLTLPGVLIGLTGAYLQAQRLLVDTPWGVLAVPWAVPVVWTVLVVVIRGGVWAAQTRWGGWAVLLGWLAVTVVLSAESPSGDVAISGGVRQFAYLIGGVILGSAAASVGLPARRRD